MPLPSLSLTRLPASCSEKSLDAALPSSRLLSRCLSHEGHHFEYSNPKSNRCLRSDAEREPQIRCSLPTQFNKMTLSNEVIIVICIIGAAALVTIGYAVHSLFRKIYHIGHNFTQSDSQKQYMREVRGRNIMEAFGDPRQQRHRPTDI